MREILFRGKRVTNGEWVTGFYSVGRITGDTYIDGEKTSYIVRPDTIGQYIGLRDVNGKRIFEGDIVQNALNGGGANTKCKPSVVEYDNFNCTCCNGVYGWSFNDGYADIRDDEVVIIGNIHDNPELMEVSK